MAKPLGSGTADFWGDFDCGMTGPLRGIGWRCELATNPLQRTEGRRLPDVQSIWETSDIHAWFDRQ